MGLRPKLARDGFMPQRAAKMLGIVSTGEKRHNRYIAPIGVISTVVSILLISIIFIEKGKTNLKINKSIKWYYDKNL